MTIIDFSVQRLDNDGDASVTSSAAQLASTQDGGDKSSLLSGNSRVVRRLQLAFRSDVTSTASSEQPPVTARPLDAVIVLCSHAKCRRPRDNGPGLGGGATCMNCERSFCEEHTDFKRFFVVNAAGERAYFCSQKCRSA